MSANNLSTSIQNAANIILNILNQVTQTDCGVSTNFSSQAINSSYSLLEELSELSLKSSNSSGQPNNTIQTQSFLLYTTLINSTNLSNLTIPSSSDTGPQVTFGNVMNQNVDSNNLPNLLAISYIYLKENPLSCNKASPSINFTLDIKDGATLKPVEVAVPVQVSYPKSRFGSIISCPNSVSCSKTVDSNGNSVCNCQDISIFNVKAQLANIYERSQLKQLNLENFKKLFSSLPVKKWAFWIALVFTV